MAQEIKNIKQLAKALESKMASILELVAEDVKHEVDDYLQDYYDEYDPAFGKLFSSWFYERTDQLRNCCKISKPKINNGKIGIEVYLDVNSLDYNTPGADPYKSLVAANSGLHGGFNPSYIIGGQVPWSAISGNTGDRFGTGTQIWKEPMEELINNGKLITIFKKCAKQRGLNIK